MEYEVKHGHQEEATVGCHCSRAHELHRWVIEASIAPLIHGGLQYSHNNLLKE